MRELSSIEFGTALVRAANHTESVDQEHVNAAAAVMTTMPHLAERSGDFGLGAEELMAAHHDMISRDGRNLTGSITARRPLPADNIPVSARKFSLPYCPQCHDRTGTCACLPAPK